MPLKSWGEILDFVLYLTVFGRFSTEALGLDISFSKMICSIWEVSDLDPGDQIPDFAI